MLPDTATVDPESGRVYPPLVLGWATFLLTLYVFLLVAALCLNAPLIGTLLFAGNRLPPSKRLVAATGLTVAAVFVTRNDWLAGALVVNAALIAALLFVRTRLDPRSSGLMLAAGFFAASVYVLWRMEWFDVWRHGIPPANYVLKSMGPYATPVALAGWLLGVRIGPWRSPCEDQDLAASRRSRIHLTHPRP